MKDLKGAIECKICGRIFALNAEETYVARDIKQQGIAMALKSEETKIYDAIDCPHCGCQNILQERKRDLNDDILYSLEEDTEDDK